MTTLVRRNPYRETVAFRNAMDRFFNEPIFNTPVLWQRGEGFRPAVDIAENDDAYIVTASVPGIDPEDIEITLDKDVVTIKGETQSESEKEGEKYHVRERSYGKFTRSFRLPVAVDGDNIEAINENGILTLTVPKSEAVKPKRIAVKSGS